jgi:bifunctional DNA-binding transcriptional regulator/antitoxin component of YhaV-PrlF toxin-antitoxin module
MSAVEVDDRYRLTIPRDAREGIKPGDVFFVERDVEGLLHYAKAENPFDGLARHAIAEYCAGRTRSLREIAQEAGATLDAPETHQTLETSATKSTAKSTTNAKGKGTKGTKGTKGQARVALNDAA